MFDTKIAIVIREDLATWQKLNVTAFLDAARKGPEPCLERRRTDPQPHRLADRLPPPRGHIRRFSPVWRDLKRFWKRADPVTRRRFATRSIRNGEAFARA